MFVQFYDNSWHNRDVNIRCPYIIYNKVFCDQNFQHHSSDNETFDNFILNESASVQQISSMYSQHHYDPMSGLQLESGDDFFDHVENMARSTQVSAFVFDWDRTLQPYESMLTCSVEHLRRQYAGNDFRRALAIYHAGGHERFQKIRHMFGVINQCKKKICILTGNPAILTEGRSIYIAVLREWGVIPLYLAYALDKYDFMVQDIFLQSVSGPMLRF